MPGACYAARAPLARSLGLATSGVATVKTLRCAGEAPAGLGRYRLLVGEGAVESVGDRVGLLPYQSVDHTSIVALHQKSVLNQKSLSHSSPFALMASFKV